ncbi:unnamed protein product [Didymodactylos carnosus]|uniref:Uncharacterized protein n=1 Tax=Didymodactylos carnosus TaxID=1234261 RepID=A0A814G0X2_9BILA|nr:unnamed protein product [Didymodactylos carnosus]CAF3762225.1 unnamed protein product [Didymodactylos carnosus]
MTTQRSSRIRQTRKPFTPTTPEQPLPEYYLLYFEESDTYNIVKRSSTYEECKQAWDCLLPQPEELEDNENNYLRDNSVNHRMPLNSLGTNIHENVHNPHSDKRSNHEINTKRRLTNEYQGRKRINVYTFLPFSIFHDQNLIQIRGKDYGDYARKVLRVLFTKEELTTSVLPPGAPYLRRDPLDETRFELLQKAVGGKYRISRDYYSEFYKNLLRRKLADFLIEERRRDGLKELRVRQRSITAIIQQNDLT